ncbi:hypothetical protein ACFSQT_21075 [Mesorhizobium calcicola]|uniref:Transposase n=1 Tax=Mesorhizobium calcicola TaxID=1300310 RepID=A0ABW4WFU4_9HYPH
MDAAIDSNGVRAARTNWPVLQLRPIPGDWSIWRYWTSPLDDLERGSLHGLGFFDVRREIRKLDAKPARTTKHRRQKALGCRSALRSVVSIPFPSTIMAALQLVPD